MNIPIYNALINDEDDGLVCVSIVNEPATEINYVLFNKDKQKQTFAIINEEKHLLSSVIMICDVPIYRYSESIGEYYIKYNAETIKKMAQKMLADGTFNIFDFDHNGERLENGKIQLVELYIKDEDKGINPNFIDVPNGSLMATYKIEDDGIWEMVKSGEYNGLSLEGYFSIEECQTLSKIEDKDTDEILELINQLKEKLNKHKK